jgi:hypothetical protein
MNRYAWLALGLLCFTASEANTKAEKAACAKVKEKIRTIESKMRSGYTRAQGEKYEAKLRELRAERYHLCR